MADKDPIATLEKLEQALSRRVGAILWDTLARGRDWLRAREPLKRRTKGMPYVRKPIKLQGNLLEAGLYAPPTWAGAHIGPAGSATVITPQRGKFLAIPTDFARKGVKSPKAYAGTVVFGGIIWGKAGWGGARSGGGLRQRRAAGESFRRQDLVPLFILKGSVIIQKRIDPAQVVAYMQPLFLAALQKACLLDRL
jgi:hypothetical protein